MIIYNIFFIFLLMFALLDLSIQRKSLLLFILPLLALFFLAGFRGNGGDDFLVYEEYFYAIPEEIYNYGYGYLGLNVIVKYFGDYSLFILISSFICISLQSIFIYHEAKSPCVILFLFYATSFLWLDFILIRQSIAVGFFIIAIIFYKKSYNGLTFLFFFFACLFHETTLFAALLFYVFSKTKGKTLFLTIVLLGVISPFFFEILTVVNNLTIRNKNISAYLSYQVLPSTANIVEFLIAALCFAFMRRQIRDDNSREYIAYQSILISSFFVLLLSYSVPTLARFLEFFRIFYLILLVRLLMQLETISRYLIFIFIVVYCFLRINSFVNQFDSGFGYIFNGISL